MAQHKQELANAAERFDLDRQRQMLGMREKLALNRKKKMDALRRKQESELTRESMLQQKEVDEIRGKKVQKILRVSQNVDEWYYSVEFILWVFASDFVDILVEGSREGRNSGGFEGERTGRRRQSYSKCPQQTSRARDQQPGASIRRRAQGCRRRRRA